MKTRASRAAAVAAGFLCVLAGLSGMAAAGIPVVVPVPEFDAGSMASAMTLLSGGLLIIAGRRRGK